MPSSLILSSINPFAILWAAVVWMIAGLIVGVLVAIPFYFIVLSSNNSNNPEEAAQRATMFVVAALTLAGLLIGANLEYNKQLQPNRTSYLPNHVQQNYLINQVIPSKSFRELP